MPGGRAKQVRRAELSETVVERLQTIASPNRLRLLTMLQDPLPVSEIDLTVSNAPDEPERNITRQGVRHHLNKLEDAGFVTVQRGSRGGKSVNEYVADRSRLYELGEVLRGMPGALTGPPEELGAPPTWEQPPTGAPSLTVVHGAEIGHSFALSKEPKLEGRGWVIGQDADVDVVLDWDSYVGPQAGEVVREDGSYKLVDLRATPRRASLNGEALERGEVRELSDRDLVGVGRSLLWFRE